MIKEFGGKVAVITGGGSGIGRSLAHAFAKREMKIVLTDINENLLNTVTDELSEKGVEVLSMVVDVSDRDQVAHLADATYDRFGATHILCNNAGVSSGGRVKFLTLADWDWVLGINLFGVIYGVKSFLPRMLESGDQCHIVNTASIAGLLAGENGPYNVSKFGVVALSEVLRNECFNTNVGISVICPGYVKTGILKNIEIFRQNRPDFYHASDKLKELVRPVRENSEKMLNEGMDPDIVAEKVILAIMEDIPHIITHPEFVPLIEARTEGITASALKLDQLFTGSSGTTSEPGATDQELQTYNHDVPAFSIQYPGDFEQFNPPLMPNVIFYTLRIPSTALFIRLIDKSAPNLPPDFSLENAAKYAVLSYKNVGSDINIISNKMTTLQDGTTANEGLIELRRSGIIKRKNLVLTTSKDNYWINVVVSSLANEYSEDFKKILYSLKFK